AVVTARPPQFENRWARYALSAGLSRARRLASGTVASLFLDSLLRRRGPRFGPCVPTIRASHRTAADWHPVSRLALLHFLAYGLQRLLRALQLIAGKRGEARFHVLELQERNFLVRGLVRALDRLHERVESRRPFGRFPRGAGLGLRVLVVRRRLPGPFDGVLDVDPLRANLRRVVQRHRGGEFRGAGHVLQYLEQHDLAGVHFQVLVAVVPL